MTQVRPQDGRDYQEVRLADEIIPFLTENSEKVNHTALSEGRVRVGSEPTTQSSRSPHYGPVS